MSTALIQQLETIEKDNKHCNCGKTSAQKNITIIISNKDGK